MIEEQQKNGNEGQYSSMVKNAFSAYDFADISTNQNDQYVTRNLFHTARTLMPMKSWFCTEHKSSFAK